jgi:hypothetical protein
MQYIKDKSLSAYYELANDIDAYETKNWNAGLGWMPIGNYNTRFTGSLDGKGHIIAGLTVKQISPLYDGLSSTYYAGLFGYLNNATIKEIKLASFYVEYTTDSYSYFYGGPVAGMADNSLISKIGIYDLKQVKVYSYDVGGSTGCIVGAAIGTTSILDCYVNTANSISNTYTVALAYIESTVTISNCYVSVSGLEFNKSMGGIISNCYLNKDVATTSGTTGVTELTSSQMQQQSSFTGFDFINTWRIDPSNNNGMPTLRAFTPDMTGSGTQSDPYKIYTVLGLDKVRNNLSAYYELANNIDASIVKWWDSGAGWIPIGSSSNQFMGKFDGKGYYINDLYINRPSAQSGSYNGLFGYIMYGTVKNLGLINVNITSNGWVGAIAGRALSGYPIENCYSTGMVDGFEFSAGISASIGGSGTIRNCYSKCTVKSSPGGSVGGISATGSSGNADSCYFAGVLTTTGTKYGCFPNLYMCTAPNCFWDSTTTGLSSGGLGTSKTTTEMKTQSTYTYWNFTDIWVINNTNQGYPHLKVFDSITSINMMITSVLSMLTTQAKLATVSAIKNIIIIEIKPYINENIVNPTLQVIRNLGISVVGPPNCSSVANNHNVNTQKFISLTATKPTILAEPKVHIVKIDRTVSTVNSTITASAINPVLKVDIILSITKPSSTVAITSPTLIIDKKFNLTKTSNTISSITPIVKVDRILNVPLNNISTSPHSNISFVLDRKNIVEDVYQTVTVRSPILKLWRSLRPDAIVIKTTSSSSAINLTRNPSITSTVNSASISVKTPLLKVDRKNNVTVNNVSMSPKIPVIKVGRVINVDRTSISTNSNNVSLIIDINNSSVKSSELVSVSNPSLSVDIKGTTEVQNVSIDVVNPVINITRNVSVGSDSSNITSEAFNPLLIFGTGCITTPTKVTVASSANIPILHIDEKLLITAIDCSVESKDATIGAGHGTEVNALYANQTIQSKLPNLNLVINRVLDSILSPVLVETIVPSIVHDIKINITNTNINNSVISPNSKVGIREYVLHGEITQSIASPQTRHDTIISVDSGAKATLLSAADISIQRNILVSASNSNCDIDAIQTNIAIVRNPKVDVELANITNYIINPSFNIQKNVRLLDESKNTNTKSFAPQTYIVRNVVVDSIKSEFDYRVVNPNTNFCKSVLINDNSKIINNEAKICTVYTDIINNVPMSSANIYSKYPKLVAGRTFDVEKPNINVLSKVPSLSICIEERILNASMQVETCNNNLRIDIIPKLDHVNTVIEAINPNLNVNIKLQTGLMHEDVNIVNQKLSVSVCPKTDSVISALEPHTPTVYVGSVIAPPMLKTSFVGHMVKPVVDRIINVSTENINVKIQSVDIGTGGAIFTENVNIRLSALSPTVDVHRNVSISINKEDVLIDINKVNLLTQHNISIQNTTNRILTDISNPSLITDVVIKPQNGDASESTIKPSLHIVRNILQTVSEDNINFNCIQPTINCIESPIIIAKTQNILVSVNSSDVKSIKNVRLEMSSAQIITSIINTEITPEKIVSVRPLSVNTNVNPSNVSIDITRSPMLQVEHIGTLVSSVSPILTTDISLNVNSSDILQKANEGTRLLTASGIVSIVSKIELELVEPVIIPQHNLSLDAEVIRLNVSSYNCTVSCNTSIWHQVIILEPLRIVAPKPIINALDYLTIVKNAAQIKGCVDDLSQIQGCVDDLVRIIAHIEEII